MRTGQSELYPFIPAELIEAAAVNEDHLAILRRLGFTSALVAPLNGREGVFGAVTLIHAESGRRYGDEDVAFLEEIADRVAVAFDTAALGDDLALLLASYDPSTERDLTAPDATNPRAPVDT